MSKMERIPSAVQSTLHKSNQIQALSRTERLLHEPSHQCELRITLCIHGNIYQCSDKRRVLILEHPKASPILCKSRDPWNSPLNRSFKSVVCSELFQMSKGFQPHFKESSIHPKETISMVAILAYGQWPSVGHSRASNATIKPAQWNALNPIITAGG